MVVPGGPDSGLEVHVVTLSCCSSGFAPNYAEALGSRGGEAISKFVKGGGGYVGICAGAYLASDWGYELLEVNKNT